MPLIWGHITGYMKKNRLSISSKGELLKEIARLTDREVEVVVSDSIVEAPLVSVCMFTYNHGDYLKEAVESVLDQDFEGSFELVIADDCSTDGSGDWLRELQKEHPENVYLLLGRRNLWNEVFPGTVLAILTVAFHST